MVAPIVHRSAVVLALGLATLTACGDDTAETTTTTTGSGGSGSGSGGGSGGSGGADDTTLKLVSPDPHSTFACSSEPPFSGTFDVDEVESCTYRPAAGRLELLLDRTATPASDDSLYVNIAGFIGVTSYTTTASLSENDDTFVTLQGTASDGNLHVGSSATLDDCTGPCTIDVTDAGVFSAGPGQTGRLTLTVDCPSLVALGPTCFNCTYTPSTIAIDIEHCQRDD